MAHSTDTSPRAPFVVLVLNASGGGELTTSQAASFISSFGSGRNAGNQTQGHGAQLENAGPLSYTIAGHLY